MKLKIVLQGIDKIKSFVTAVQMLSRHSDRLIFIATKDKLTILTEKPIIWVDINIVSFALDYKFNGSIQDDMEKDYIYFDIKSKNALFPLEALVNSNIDYTEISLIKTPQNTPFLKVFSKTTSEQLKGSFDSQIPLIVIPFEQWNTINLPREITFDCCFKIPKYIIFKKYLDIYRNFKSIRFEVNPDMVLLEAGSDIESKVMTCFKKINPTDELGDPITRSIVKVDSKKISGFIHSINVLNIHKLSIMCRIKNSTCMKLDFQNENTLIKYNAIFENVGEISEEEYHEKNMFQKYIEEIEFLDTQ